MLNLNYVVFETTIAQDNDNNRLVMQWELTLTSFLEEDKLTSFEASNSCLTKLASALQGMKTLYIFLWRWRRLEQVGGNFTSSRHFIDWKGIYQSLIVLNSTETIIHRPEDFPSHWVSKNVKTSGERVESTTVYTFSFPSQTIDFGAKCDRFSQVDIVVLCLLFLLRYLHDSACM